ncbi:flagellar basal body L-ring protein FlgH [Siccirubricoccus sp. KC 17139]|uniref:Flagellar L-ring protein n=1 Tax=Siccirubricoccus soli TaxID=2899147 RepID=A0ABT1D929_9PROT|nr:flagellar basal body L-ring protein FlgH [Siccirubricoccus soli]MCO6418411.1 flagellar basal body L-ring protein FlgH [Siccirubricoccus soli]MCP2684546.1 flagellar basal body L-ring protein FlgH [Siccirubricoccus soli]
MRRCALLALLPLAVPLAGCGSLERLSRVGRNPEMSQVTDPTSAPDYRPVTMPMPAPQDPPLAANSLWRPGSRTFLRDQRAAQVGDLITILVSIEDSAQLQNRTQRSRTGTDTMGLPQLFGLQSRWLPRAASPDTLVSANGSQATDGDGTARRSETIALRLAATVTQVLPNGNLVVAGRQEVRVSAELRELAVRGVIRPQDIASDNTIRHDRLAEARIAYGGRGTLSDLQQPRIGSQILDVLLPF